MSNRLINETSPYLLQHSDNPVNWYPWCEEAFEKAKNEDKPVFLSIGYSTCHWCHVMAHESFEDQITADILNDSFISIKVDRENGGFGPPLKFPTPHNLIFLIAIIFIILPSKINSFF